MSKVEEATRTSPFGSVPSHWQVLPLRELITLMTNGFVGTATTHYVDSGGVTYIQGFNVIDGNFNLFGIKQVSRGFHAKHAKSQLRTGDLLTIQTGEVGLSTVVPPALAGANCHALIITRFKPKVGDSRYYMRLFNSDAGRQVLRRIETGTTMKHLNVGDMLDIIVPVPPLAEQVEIADALDDASTHVQRLEHLIAKKQAIKQGMVQQLLTGRTRLRGFYGEWVMSTVGAVAEVKTGPFGSALHERDYVASGTEVPQFEWTPEIAGRCPAGRMSTCRGRVGRSHRSSRWRLLVG